MTTRDRILEAGKKLQVTWYDHQMCGESWMESNEAMKLLAECAERIEEMEKALNWYATLPDDHYTEQPDGSFVDMKSKSETSLIFLREWLERLGGE